jgi:DNA-binding MarR family transcriptional regulator
VTVPALRGTSRPSPTAEDLAVWRAFFETSEQLRSMLGSRFQSESDLSSGDYSVMLALSEAPGKKMRSSELAAHVEWERSRLSHHLGRMESRGILVRRKCADDSRGTEIVLTVEGAALFRQASSPHLKAVQELFLDALTPELLEKADEVTRALRAHLNAR